MDLYRQYYRKVVQASAIALNYGTKSIRIRERMLPLGFFWTRVVNIFAFLPVLFMMLASLPFIAIFRLPKVGKTIVDYLTPPGSGAPDWMVEIGNCSVYAVATAPASSDDKGVVDRGYAYLAFEQDPGNAVTAQCVCESALALLLERDSLPPKSVDGFGTPSELLGSALLKRFRNTKIRPVKVYTTANLGVAKNEMKVYLG